MGVTSTLAFGILGIFETVFLTSNDMPRGGFHEFKSIACKNKKNKKKNIF